MTRDMSTGKVGKAQTSLHTDLNAKLQENHKKCWTCRRCDPEGSTYAMSQIFCSGVHADDTSLNWFYINAKFCYETLDGAV